MKVPQGSGKPAVPSVFGMWSQKRALDFLVFCWAVRAPTGSSLSISQDDTLLSGHAEPASPQECSSIPQNCMDSPPSPGNVCCSFYPKAVSLCCSFTIGRSEQQKNEVQDDATDVLGKGMNTTNIYEEYGDTLRDLLDLFKEHTYTMQESKVIKDPFTLKAMMYCEYTKDGHFSASWNIALNGSQMAHLDSNIGKWTGTDSIFSGMENGGVTASLIKTSMGDCRTWLDELKLDWEKNPKPTASQATTAAVTQPLSMAFMPNPSVLLIFACFLLACFLRWPLGMDRH